MAPVGKRRTSRHEAEMGKGQTCRAVVNTDFTPRAMGAP